MIDIDMHAEEAVFNLSTTIMIEMVSQSQKQGDVDMTGFLKQSVYFVLARKRRREK